LVDRVRRRGAMLSELSPVRSSLEDIFVDLVTPSPTHPLAPSGAGEAKGLEGESGGEEEGRGR
ncbi:MAG TPA: hypothetical protein VEO37_10975, partial [Thermoanaerobaculia bacterium]|nr:hypothetical protein [Thermoanaerobaculia bacterium]